MSIRVSPDIYPKGPSLSCNITLSIDCENEATMGLLTRATPLSALRQNALYTIRDIRDEFEIYSPLVCYVVTGPTLYASSNAVNSLADAV